MSTIHLIYRAEALGRYSIERVFKPLEVIPSVRAERLPCDLNSFSSIIKLTLFSFGLKSRHIHITGDVHYMTVFLFWKKSLLTIHDCNHYEKLSGLRKKLLGILWFKLPLIFANHIIVISPFVKEQLQKYFRVKDYKISIVPNSFKSFESNHKDKRVRNRFEILSLGTKSNKNLERLIMAVSEMEAVKLNIIGNLSEGLIKLLSSNKTEFANYVNVTDAELKEHYNSSDMLFFASTREGFGLPILEAQSCGLPVLTSRTSSMPYVAGEAAIFVDPFNIEAIRQGVTQIKDDRLLRNSLIQKGYSNVKRFSEEKFLENYKAMYKKVFRIDL